MTYRPAHEVLRYAGEHNMTPPEAAEHLKRLDEAAYTPPAHEVAELCEEARETRDNVVRLHPHFRDEADEAMERFRSAARGFLAAVEAGENHKAERIEEEMDEIHQDLIWMEYGTYPNSPHR